MNFSLEWLHERGQRLGDRLPLQNGTWSSVLLTPRFHASRHVVSLLIPPGGSDCAAVMKVPRIATDDHGVRQEAEVLREVHARDRSAHACVPEVLASERWRGQWVLVQSAMHGRLMDRAMARRSPEVCVDLVVRWLSDLNTPQIPSGSPSPDEYTALVERPLGRVRAVLAGDNALQPVFRRAEAILGKLHQARFAIGVEHGDLSPPNIFILPGDRIGVIDWELADRNGLPTSDLFFFLNFLAGARHGAATQKQRRTALRRSLLSRDGWAVPVVERFARHLDIELSTLAPLAVLCWTRYLDKLIERLRVVDNGGTRAFLLSSRFFDLWRCLIDEYDDLPWSHTGDSP